MKKIIYGAVFLVVCWLLISIIFFNSEKLPVFETQITEERPSASPNIQAVPPADSSEAGWPLDRIRERASKKPFGLKISLEDSPVSPERFSGYHTGVDLEIFPGEEESEVVARAICQGPLIYKNRVSGYGGVAVQECELTGRPVTVVYGHLRLASVKAVIGQALAVGEELGVLGKGFSAETDGERKHLHLGIHLGGEVNLAGYVAGQNELAAWLDPLDYLLGAR